MSAAADDTPRTRESLPGRLRDLDDQESWRAFFERYWRLIYNVARQTGLDEDGAQEVIQETVIAVARKMPGFKCDPARGSFKQWLLRITRRRIVDRLRKIYRQPPRSEVPLEALDEDEAHAEAVTDPLASRIEASWEEQWKRTIFDAAVAEVRREANPKQFQVPERRPEGWGG